MKNIGMIALIIGGVGVLFSMVGLAGHGTPIVLVGVMISGSIIFGSGVIALAIAGRKSSD